MSSKSTRVLRRRTVGIAATLVTFGALLIGGTATAGAQELIGNPREDAWTIRNEIHTQAPRLGQYEAQVKDTVDQGVETIFPGLITEKTAAPIAPPALVFDRGPCPTSARVCVDIDGHRTWLQSDGEVSYGAVPISSGQPGQETPRGTFTINRKVVNDVSREFNNAPMPYSMYFTNNGHAFHEDDVNVASAGCIHLNHQDAVHYYDNVNIGDSVFIY